MAEMREGQGQYVFGLDIGTRSIVGTVGYLSGEQFHVVAQYAKEHETRAMLDGQIHDIGKVGETIRQVKEAVSIPVLANGDVTTADEALTLLEATGCDGVMIGRGALGDPWLFAQVRAALLGEERPPEPTLNQRMTALRDQIYEMCEEKSEWAAMPQARSQAMHYMKGLHGAAALRRYCSMLEHFSDVDTLIEAVYRLQ